MKRGQPWLKTTKRTPAVLNAFAELLAEGQSVEAAARELGVGVQTGWRMLRDLKAGLGEQAR